MSEELRVTVVATGIGQDRKPEITLVSNRERERERMQMFSPSRDRFDLDERDERPARVQRVANGGAQNSRGDMDLLDIPAFLRRQAD